MVTKTKVSKDKPRLSVALPEKARNGLRKIPYIHMAVA